MLNKFKKDVGIFGGSFDPPHQGHVKICKISLKKLKLEKLYWVVTKKNPLKKKPLFLLKDRISKSKLAVKKIKKIKVLYLDKKIKSSRTISVIDYFINLNRQNNFYLILGADSLINFHKWTKWKKIVKMVKLVVFSRRGYAKKSKKSIVVKYLNKKNIIFINNKNINISSSAVKKKLIKKT